MHITILIPTLGKRPELLSRCIRSIIASKTCYANISIHLIMGNEGYTSAMNQAFAQIDSDAFVYANDDAEFYINCIENAAKVMGTKFPDGDGLVTIRQEHGGAEFAFGLMGRKFVNRFPSRNVFCPDYTHYYTDEELARYAQSINKYHFCDDAVVMHHMPKDETKEIADSVRVRSEATWQKRQELGYLWGRDNRLINIKIAH